MRTETKPDRKIYRENNLQGKSGFDKKMKTLELKPNQIEKSTE